MKSLAMADLSFEETLINGCSSTPHSLWYIICVPVVGPLNGSFEASRSLSSDRLSLSPYRLQILARWETNS
jgi:hypothetical protein